MPETEQFATRIWQRLSPVFIQFYQENPSGDSLIFIDTETTGIAQDADIIELGAISVEPTNSASVKFSVFSELIYPRKGTYISLDAFKKHGITENELKRYGKPPKEALELFVQWIQSKSPDYLVAHNAEFDENMLYGNFIKHGIYHDFPEFLCTLKMARKLKKSGNLTIKNAKLATIADYLDCPIQPKHRSISDAEACAYIFAKMILIERFNLVK